MTHGEQWAAVLLVAGIIALMANALERAFHTRMDQVLDRLASIGDRVDRIEDYVSEVERHASDIAAAQPRPRLSDAWEDDLIAKHPDRPKSPDL